MVQEILKQNEKLKKDEDSLTEANQELERLRQDLQEARDSAADAQKRHQEEKQVVLDRMSTVTNGKVRLLRHSPSSCLCAVVYAWSLVFCCD